MTPPTTAREWWAKARARWIDGERPDPAEIDAWMDLSREDRRVIKARLDARLHHDDHAVREFAWKVTEDIAVATMDREPASEHLRLEIGAVHHRDGSKAQAPADSGGRS